MQAWIAIDRLIELQKTNSELEQQLKTAQADAVRLAADNLEAINIDGVYVVKHDDLIKYASNLEGKLNENKNHNRQNLY